MSYGKTVRDELRLPTRDLRHTIPQVYAGYRKLHDSALAGGAGHQAQGWTESRRRLLPAFR